MQVIQKIKTSYNELTSVQRKIADYFLEIDFKALDASIEEYAKQIGISTASISRFCKWMGYGSFQTFKIALSREFKFDTNFVLPIFKLNDKPDLSIRKVFSEAIINLEATEGLVNFNSIIRVSEEIRKAARLYFIGLGVSGGIGSLGELLFSKIGYNTKALNDHYNMLVSAGHTRKGDVVIGLSHSGSTRVIIESLQTAKANGAFTVGITNNSKSPLEQITDITLITSCHERKHHFAQPNSMVTQITLIHSLYILAASKSKPNIIKSVNNIEKKIRKSIRIKYKKINANNGKECS